MTLLFSAEWLRFWRNPVNGWVLFICSVILFASAILSGVAAQSIRETQLAEYTRWSTEYDAMGANAIAESDINKSNTATYNLARNTSPPLQLGGLGGLSLATSTFQTLETDIKIGVESRYADGRKSGEIGNPLLASMGMLDFSLVTAVILPLLVIGLCYGLVHEDRENGRWRLSCSLINRSWLVVAAALLIRLTLVMAALAVASAIAFLIDSGSSIQAYLLWMVSCIAFCLFWVAICAVFTLTSLSSSSTVLALISIWIGITFIAPAIVDANINNAHPSPSRLEFISEMRSIQQETEEHNDELLKQWFIDNDLKNENVASHTWPVSFIPRYIEQNRLLEPMAKNFDDTRLAQWSATHDWTWLTPTLSIISVADQLAGVDGHRYAAYLAAVTEFESRWREFFASKVMRYERPTSKQLQHVSNFGFSYAVEAQLFPEILKPLSLALLLLFVTFAYRRNLNV